MLKYAYNTNGMRNMPLIDAIERIANCGYEGVEISLHSAHLHPFQVNSQELELIKETIAGTGVIGTNIATGSADLLSDEPYEPSLICPDRAGRGKRIELLKKTMDIAEYLGIPVVTFATGYKPASISREQAEEHLIKGIERCLADHPDLILALEPEPGMMIEKVSEALPIIEKLGSRAALNLDVGHAFCCEENPMSAIALGLPYTRHIHIEDIRGRVHYHQIPGTADINFSDLLGMLVKTGYRYFASVELYHHAEVWQEALIQSINYLHRVEGGIEQTTE